MDDDDADDSLGEDRSMFGYSTGLGRLADFGELGEPERSARRAAPQPRTSAFAALRDRVFKAAAAEMARRRGGR